MKIWEESDTDVLSLIGIRLEVERATPEFYFLAFTGHSAMLPLMQDGKILMFTNKRHRQRVITMAGCEQEAAAGRRNEEWYGVGRALAYLLHEPVDQRACVLNSINLLDDLLIAVEVQRPSPHVERLNQLADYLTFLYDLDAFFASADFDRTAACDALRWCLGALFSRMILLPHIIRARGEP